MKTKAIITILVLLAWVCPAGAGIVQLDLLDLGCPTEFNCDTWEWQTDFDLGVTFSDITKVYMDWSGEITAGLVVDDDNPDNPYPLDVGIYSSLGGSPYPRFAYVWGGELTYPVPEPFDHLSEFELLGTTTWSDLLDGQGTIRMQYTESIMLYGYYVEHGSISLERAILVIDGVIVPEPATILFLIMGLIGIQLKCRHKQQ